MLQVTRAELDEIQKKYPDVKPVITSRNSKHKKYYVEEKIGVLRLVSKLRNAPTEGVRK